LSSTQYLKLETRGRRTNLPHIVELRYAWLGGRYYVLGSKDRSDWLLNALKARSGMVRLGDFMVEVSANSAPDSEKAEAMAAFERKYGSRLVRKWYGPGSTCLRLAPTGPPTKRGAVLGELDTTASFSEWASQGKDYYLEVGDAFDSASEEYDFTIGRNFINTWIRRRSLQILRRMVRPQDFLLEIGCGTGAEAIEVSDWVSGIIATDVSARMIELVAIKAKAKGLQDKIIPFKLRASEISRIREANGSRAIRVGYSFNGALNCEPDLDSFVSQLHTVLEPGGYFVCSIRNTTCASEMVSHGLALQFDRATPRKSQPTMVSVGGRDIPSTYYSPSDFARRFAPHFIPEEVVGLPALLPPAYLSNYYLKLRSISSVLERLEPLVSGIAPFNRLGDQTLFVFRNS
jgi:ubiquinone/menaquinone biosynthesis C-methylase UbiE